MKKNLISLLLALIIALSGISAFAEAQNDALPAIGSTVHGFTVKEHYRLDSLDATCVYMVHDKTGAQLTYVANEDTDRAFNITFRTPAQNDEGIPHVFEHATLCGSEKYPDPSLFFNMMFQTYNTYLNAMTMQSCTTFPAASLSEEQLYVYADYVLSGVFHPLIMTDERAMMREAYRYELQDADADITLAGTVYSEMQGNMNITSRAGINIRKLLYPGSITANVAGGDPDFIPDMTHQELKDFHDAYYHPSNSMIVLYGKLDYDRFLKLIDEEYLSEYDYRDITLDDSAYEPYEGFREEVYTFPVAQDASSQPVTMYGIALPEATAADAALFNIICSSLMNESSSFMNLFHEKMPEAMVGATFTDTTDSPMFLVMGMNVSAEEKDEFKSLVDEAIANVLSEGLDMGVVESLCRVQHYTDVISRGQSGVGTSAAMNIATDWGQTTDPFSYKTKTDILNNLTDYIEKDAFNDAFKRNFSNVETSAMVVMTPDVGGLERQSAELQKKLSDKKAAMTDEEIAALVARTEDFSRWTSDNAENSMIDKVKVVSVETLPEESVRYEAEDSVVNGMRTITSKAELSDVLKIGIEFDASALPYEMLQDYSVMCQLMLSMPTKNHTSQEISALLTDVAYVPSVSASTISYKDGGYAPTFHVTWTTTRDKLEESFALFEEILYNVDFSDADLIRRTLRDNAANSKMMATIMPDYLLLSYGAPLVNDDSLYSNYLTGEANMAYQEEISEMSDEEIAEVAKRMAEVRDILLNKNGLIFTCSGTEESIDLAVKRAGELYEKLDDTAREKADYTGKLTRLEQPVACVIDGTMQFNMQIASMKDSGFENNGKMLAMSKLVYDKILLPVLRFENSAYGARSSLDAKYVYVSSYRDPNLAKTYEVYKGLGERIRALDVTQDDLDGYITNSYSSLAAPVSAYAGSDTAISDILTGETTFDDNLRFMKEIKQFTLEDVKAYSVIYDMLAEKGSKVTVGGAEAINENRDMFKTVDTTYVQ